MYCSRRVFPAAIYLALLVTSALWDNSESLCPESGAEEAGELTYELRQTACNLNLSATQLFHSQIRAKHGAVDDVDRFFIFGRFFQHLPIKVWCRNSCPDFAAENITWCVNIVNFDHNVETCISPSGANSSCGAQLVGLEKFLSLPEDCAFAGGVGCLGLTDLDWYFKNAYLTCTVNTDTCYDKSFTFLNILPSTVTEPVIDVFPESPLKVTLGDTMVLHAVATSTTDRNLVTWRHGNTTFSQHIREDPFCNPEVENCPIDNQPNVTNLRRQRVRMYLFSRLVQLTGCQNVILYRIESYLIIDNSTANDVGEYVFNITSRYTTGSETAEQNVTTIVEPVIDMFPESPLKVTSGDTTVLHAEVTSISSRNYAIWRHGNTICSWYIQEDPFCNPAVEHCSTDNNPNATDWRRQRVRMYFYPRLVKLTGCQNILLYRIESYLIINNTNVSDGGEYVFSSTSKFHTGPETVERNVTIIVECEDSPLPLASCDHNHSISLNMGHSVSWSCQLRAAQNATMTLMLNGSPLPPSLLGESCDKAVSVSFHVEERVDDFCYSTYTVSVHICAASSNVEGEYVVAVGEEVLEGTKFLLKMADPPTGEEDNSGTVSVVAYAAPVAVLILVVLLFVVVLLVLLMKRKCRRQHTYHRMNAVTSGVVDSPL